MKDNIKNIKNLNEFTTDVIADFRDKGYDEWNQASKGKQEEVIRRIEEYLKAIKKEHNR